MDNIHHAFTMPDQHMTGGGTIIAIEYPQQGRLADTGRTLQHQRLAAMDREADIAENRQGHTALIVEDKGLGDLSGFKHRDHCGHFLGWRRSGVST